MRAAAQALAARRACTECAASTAIAERAQLFEHAMAGIALERRASFESAACRGLAQQAENVGAEQHARDAFHTEASSDLLYLRSAIASERDARRSAAKQCAAFEAL